MTSSRKRLCFAIYVIVGSTHSALAYRRYPVGDGCVNRAPCAPCVGQPKSTKKGNVAAPVSGSLR